MVTTLKRPLTLKFSTRGLGRLTESDVVEALKLQRVDVSTIRAVKLTESECRITTADEKTKKWIKSNRPVFNNKRVLMSDACKLVTNVTIKDAPFELSDDSVVAAMSACGEVVTGSLWRGKIKDTEIESGTRYLSIYDADEIIPSEMDIEEFTVRIFCDNNRTRCKHCTMTTHPHYRCPAKPAIERRCYRCFSSSHVIKDCTNDIMCKFCGQKGHKGSKCESRIELNERDRFGDYFHEINEARKAKEEEESWRQVEESSTCTAKNTGESNAGVANHDEQLPESEVKNKLDASSNTINVGIPIPVIGDTRLLQLKPESQTDDVFLNENKPRQFNNAPTHTLILGDSNLTNIDNPASVYIKAVPGDTFSSIGGLITDVSKEIDISNVKTVVLHLGTNDITQSGGSDSMLNAGTALNKLEKRLLDVTVAMCSVPPRCGSGRQLKNLNEETVALNDCTRAACRRSKKAMFIDTSPSLVNTDGSATKRMFSKYDHSGVHLNNTGRVEVISTIMAHLSNHQDKETEEKIAKRKASSSPAAIEHHAKKNQLTGNNENERPCAQSVTARNVSTATVPLNDPVGARSSTSNTALTLDS